MRIVKSLALALFSSVVLALSLPNELLKWGSPVLGLVALAPLFVALSTARSYRAAYLVGAVFGGFAHGLSSYWLWFFKDFRFWTLGTTILAYMFVYGFIGVYLRGAIRRGGTLRPLLFAMAWTVFEWGKSSGFLGYPWGLVAYSWNTVLPVTQVAESTGVYGISFALAWASASLGDLLSGDASTLGDGWNGGASFARFAVPPRLAGRMGKVASSGQLAGAAALLAAFAVFGVAALAKPRDSDRVVKAVMVQQNVDSWKGSEAENLSVSIRLARQAIADGGGKPDVVIFSETTLRRPWNGFQRFYSRTPKDDPLAGFVADTGAYLFTGAPEILDYDTYEATNSVILIGPDLKQKASYAKMHPVPFAEAIPFWEYDPFRKFIQDVVGLESGWIMGSERVLFRLPTQGAGTVTFAAPICFEDAFAYLCREFVDDGAELLVNLTNDAWSKTDSAEIQHFVAARFRAIELRRTLVRSTNGGVSAVVGPDGRIIESLPLFESDSRLVDIPVYTGERTPYLDYGDWFVAALAVALCAVVAALFADGLASGRGSRERA